MMSLTQSYISNSKTAAAALVLLVLWLGIVTEADLET